MPASVSASATVGSVRLNGLRRHGAVGQQDRHGGLDGQHGAASPDVNGGAVTGEMDGQSAGEIAAAGCVLGGENGKRKGKRAGGKKRGGHSADNTGRLRISQMVSP